MTAALLVCAAGSALGTVSATMGSFTFDSLAPGNLVGQDGWTNGGSDPSPTLQIGGGIDSTLAATGSAPINADARQAAVHAGGGVSGLLGTGGATGQFITMQIQWMEHIGFGYTSMFGPGQRVAGPNFNNFSMGFWMGVGFGELSFGSDMLGGLASDRLLDIKPTYDSGDWFEAKAVVDLLANGGNGSGSLFVRDMTDGESTFTAVPDAQNVNLNILSNSAPDPTQWNGVVLWLEGGYGGFGAADNLSYQVVPEPATASLLVLFLALTLRHFLSRRAQLRV